MQLLAYIPAATTGVFRTLRVLDLGLEPGHVEELKLFNCVFNNVEIVSTEVPGVSDILIRDAYSWRVDPHFIRLDAEYSYWCGKHTPSIEQMLDAHIMKGHVPDLIADFDQFIAWLKAELAKLPRVATDDLKFAGSEMKHGNNRYDLWLLFKHYLMLDGQMTLTHSPENDIGVSDLFISDKGVRWWLVEHNKTLMDIARSSNMLAAYITFDTRRGAHYSFVYDDGQTVVRHVDESEFMHMAVHGQFPKVSITESDTVYDLNFDFAEFFTEKYHKYNNHVFIGGQSEARDLVRFI
ncbi:hypothetical protein pEaSNUABM52_00047 [Erwinia phage pEp_SNUABM_52]|nr:hypothetical protein pEaSNUABM52_00047 [Erwinia phage pEp_SNUABM_52]